MKRAQMLSVSINSRDKPAETPGLVGAHHKLVVVVQEPVIEIDHAAHELRRENPDAAVIEQVDAGRLRHILARAAFDARIEDRVVAEMRVAVDDAIAAERIPPGGEHRGRKRIAHRERIVLVRKHARAFEPVEREQAAGGQFGPGARHAHDVAALKHEAVKRDVLGFAAIVELLTHARADLLADLAGVDGGVEAAADREQPLQLLQIGFDRRLHVGILQLAGQGGAVERAGAMYLAERSGGGRMMLEACEFLLPIRPQLRLHAPFDEGPAHRRRLALQLGELGGIFRRQQIGDGRHQLGDLHQRAFKIAERAGERRGFAGAIGRAAQNPPARIARRHPTHIGADAGVARGAGGEAVLFAVGHECSRFPILLKPDPEKACAGLDPGWDPVFGKDHAQTNG